MARFISDWAWSVAGLSAPHKYVLCYLAHWADEFGLVWHSQPTIATGTGHDRKTVKAALQQLCELGLICDTGQRRGYHNGCVVYQVNYDAVGSTPPKNGKAPVRDRPNPVRLETDQPPPNTDTVNQDSPDTDSLGVDKSTETPQKRIGSPDRDRPNVDSLTTRAPVNGDRDPPFFPSRPPRFPIETPQKRVAGNGNESVRESYSELASAHEDAKVSQKAKAAPGSRIAKAAERRAAVAAQRARDAETAAKFLEGLQAQRAAEAGKRQSE